LFGSIAVLYDGSECSHAGFEFASQLAASAGGRILLVQAMESPYDALMRSPEPIPGLEELLKKDEEARIEGLSAVAAEAPDEAAVTIEVLHGPAGSTLLDFLERVKPDLVVAGTRGMGLTRFVLGSVSQQLLEQAPCDLLLFRVPEVPGGDLQVIACVDDSPYALRAASVAGDLASALETDLVLTHVADMRLPLAQSPYASVRTMLRSHGAEVLAAAREHLELPAGRVSEDLREGDPREELLEACSERAPAIAVVGHHGAGRLRSLFLGSTARELVHRARCPILIVRGDDGGSEEPGR
jgi:nucleotide-binding universal stress UspA family protein